MKCAVLDWSNLHEHGDLWWRLLSHRYDVFVDGLGWAVPTADRSRFADATGAAAANVEFDQYDGPLATYIVALDDAGAIQASARLVRTDTSYRFGPYDVSYMIRDASAGLLDNIPATLLNRDCPVSAETWELTRYTSHSRQASKALFDTLNNFLVSVRAQNVLTLSPPSFVRWLKALKFEGAVVGPEVTIDNQAFAVVSTTVNYAAAGLDDVAHREDADVVREAA